MTTPKRFWQIDGWDSTSRIFGMSVPFGYLSERAVEHLLQILVAKNGLSNEEMVAACCNRRACIRSSLLEVQRSSQPPFALRCGENPHFIATVHTDRSPTHAP
jgi:hypothetical protein